MVSTRGGHPWYVLVIPLALEMGALFAAHANETIPQRVDQRLQHVWIGLPPSSFVQANTSGYQRAPALPPEDTNEQDNTWGALDNATSDASTAQHAVVMFVSFVRGELPIKRIVYGLDGKTFSADGYTATQPVYFEASMQSNTFYIRELNRVTGKKSKGAVVESTNAIIWGMTRQGKAWIVQSNTSFFSSNSTNHSRAFDPPASQVREFQNLANFALRLGFDRPIIPETLRSINNTQLQARTERFGTISIDIQLDSSNRIASARYTITMGSDSGSSQITYSYQEDGKRPYWLPYSVAFSLDETRNGRKQKPYTLTNWITACELGINDLATDGFTPAEFLADPRSSETVVYSNQVGYVIRGTNVAMIAPAITSNYQLSRSRVRLLSLVILVSSSVLCLCVALRSRRRKGKQ